ncbi:hypothetical protein ACFSHR_27075 [Azotobacter chroococcum]
MTHETTAPVTNLVDEVLADLSRAEKTHLDSEVRDIAREAYRLIRQQQAELAKQAAPVAVPDGWKIVPIVPTEEMVKASDFVVRRSAFETWERMLAAAPTPPAQQPVTPIGKVLSDDEMGASYDRRMGRIIWFCSPEPGFIYASPLLPAAPPAQQPEKSGYQLGFRDGAEVFACYLLDNCERETVYEESLQQWLNDMLRAHHAPPAPEQAEQQPVAWARQCDLDGPDDVLFVSRHEYQKTGYSVALYVTPIAQIEQDAVTVPRGCWSATCTGAAIG